MQFEVIKGATPLTNENDWYTLLRLQGVPVEKVDVKVSERDSCIEFKFRFSEGFERPWFCSSKVPINSAMMTNDKQRRFMEYAAEYVKEHHRNVCIAKGINPDR